MVCHERNGQKFLPLLHSDILSTQNKFKHLDPLVKLLCFAHLCKGNLESKTHIRKKTQTSSWEKKYNQKQQQQRQQQLSAVLFKWRNKKFSARLSLCHNEMLNREWLWQQKFVSLTFVEVKSRYWPVWFSSESCVLPHRQLTFCSAATQDGEKLCGVSYAKDTETRMKSLLHGIL